VQHDQPVDRLAVTAWVGAYEDAWRENDADAAISLFTSDVRYRPSPYEPSAIGHEGVRTLWPDEPGTDFTMGAEVVAVEGVTAVVRVVVRYRRPREQEYTDLWLLRFADDGRVEDFEEWAYWPGREYSAPPER